MEEAASCKMISATRHKIQTGWSLSQTNRTTMELPWNNLQQYSKTTLFRVISRQTFLARDQAQSIPSWREIIWRQSPRQKVLKTAAGYWCLSWEKEKETKLLICRLMSQTNLSFTGCLHKRLHLCLSFIKLRLLSLLKMDKHDTESLQVAILVHFS